MMPLQAIDCIAAIRLFANDWLILAIFATVLGACVGSFLNVCIYRIPLDQSVVKPRSHCMSCGSQIAWYHNLPVISYFMLRGKCAKCGASFSFRYAAVELLVAFLFLAVFCMWPPLDAIPPAGFRPLDSPFLIPAGWMFLSGLVVATFVDFDHMIIPDSCSLGGAVAGLILSAILPQMQSSVSFDFNTTIDVVTGEIMPLARPILVYPSSRGLALLASVVGIAAGAIPLYILRGAGTWYLRKRGRIGREDWAMGLGDVKFIAAIGAFLGWQGAVFALTSAAFFGVAAALPLIVLGKRKLVDRIPFGPYLALGAATWYFWGPRLVAAYFLKVAPWNVSFVV